MNENGDVKTKNGEQSVKPTCESGITPNAGKDLPPDRPIWEVLTEIGAQVPDEDWAAMEKLYMCIANALKYSTALDAIRARLPKPSVWISSDVDIDKILKTVGK